MLGLRHQSTVPVEALHATLISRFEALSMIGVDRGTTYLPAPPNPATSRFLTPLRREATPPLIYAGWLPQGEVFGWRGAAGLKIGRRISLYGLCCS